MTPDDQDTPGRQRDDDALTDTFRATRDELEPELDAIWLLVLGDGGLYATHTLTGKAEAVLGRGEACDVRIDHPSISRRHALLRLGDPMTLTDLGSANGTRVGEKPLEPGQPRAIRLGEIIDLGQMMLMVQRRSTPFRARRLWPHGYFEARLAEECARSERSGTGFAVGRVRCAGNLPAAGFEAALTGALRSLDVVGSYAPNEYEVLLLDASAAEVEALLARLKAQLEELGETVALGVAYFPDDGSEPDVLISIAGQRLREETDPSATLPDAGPRAGSAMPRLRRLAERIAQSDISVIISGETGVGKEVLAEAIHRSSARGRRPFLRLHCAALSESLLESELFGHERGAFTGAVAAKPGLLETAEGGTVFLDELGELPLSIQVKLLRVLEERKVLRVGSLVPRAIDVRFIAATNRDLELEVARGRFRKDLFFRLNGMSLLIPPLRERTDEIAALARDFAAECSRRDGRAVPPELSADAMVVLSRYAWPGNIRELRNVVERAVLLCGSGPIRSKHLPLEKMASTIAAPTAEPAPEAPPESPPPPAAPPPEDEVERLRSALADVERQRIVDALNQCAGNQSSAAELLGMSRSAFIKRLNRFGIARPRRKGSP